MVRVQKNYGGIKLRLSSIAQDDRNFNVFAFVFSHFLAICWQKKKKKVGEKNPPPQQNLERIKLCSSVLL